VNTNLDLLILMSKLLFTWQWAQTNTFARVWLSIKIFLSLQSYMLKKQSNYFLIYVWRGQRRLELGILQTPVNLHFCFEQYFSTNIEELWVSSSLFIFVAVRPIVNFINVLRAPFSYESALRSFSLVTFWL